MSHFSAPAGPSTSPWPAPASGPPCPGCRGGRGPRVRVCGCPSPATGAGAPSSCDSSDISMTFLSPGSKMSIFPLMWSEAIAWIRPITFSVESNLSIISTINEYPPRLLRGGYRVLFADYQEQNLHDATGVHRRGGVRSPVAGRRLPAYFRRLSNSASVPRVLRLWKPMP